MDNFPDRIRYHYEQDRQAILRPSHGVWGGINPHGEIEMCFYEESDIPPRISEMSIGPDGTPGEERAVPEDDIRHIRRLIHTRLLLNYDTARAVADWLQERLGELDAGEQGTMFEHNPGPRQ